MTRLTENLYIHTCYQTRGSSMHVAVNVNAEASELLSTSKQDSYETIQRLLGIPYEFVRRRVKKPPRNLTLDIIINHGLFVLVCIALVFIGLYRIMLM